MMMKSNSIQKIWMLLATILLFSFLLTPVFMHQNVLALSAEQKRLIDSGVLYLDIGQDCSTNPAQDVSQGNVNVSTLEDATVIGTETGPLINPTAVMLHWTTAPYENPQQLIDVLKSRTDSTYPEGRMVQLFVDKTGQVFQITEALETRPIQTMPGGPADPWNDVSIGIEIENSQAFPEGTPIESYEQDIRSNQVQYDTVVNITKQLVEKYDMPIEQNFAEKKGIFGHFEANPGNSDPGQGYLNDVRAAVAAGGGESTPEDPENPEDPEADTEDGEASPPPPPVSTSSVVSCTCGSQGSAAGPFDFSGSNNPEIVFNFFKSQGLSDAQAAGITGNAMVESGPNIDPRASNNGNYYGIFQWDNNLSGDRWGGLVAWAHENGKDEWALETQLEYSTIDEPEHLVEIRNYDDVPGATEYWGRYYERAITDGAVQKLAERIEYAEQVFAEYGGGSGGSSTTTATTSTSGACSGSGGLAVSPEGFYFPMQTTKAVILAGAGGATWNTEATDNQHHDYNAADIFAEPGTIVVASKPGKAVRAFDENCAQGDTECTGTRVIIKGSEEGFVYFYTHMEAGSLAITEGSDVEAGQILGTVGQSKQAQGTAPHLHFDMLPPEFETRHGCSDAGCLQYPFINVQPTLVEVYPELPDN